MLIAAAASAWRADLRFTGRRPGGRARKKRIRWNWETEFRKGADTSFRKQALMAQSAEPLVVGRYGIM
jgi:hypothetical protein